MGSQALNITASFTRPADTTAYAASDLVANSTTNTSVVPMTFTIGTGYSSFKLYSATVLKSTNTVTNSKYKLHLYGASPTGIANGDNGAWSTNNNSYIDNIAIDQTGNTFVDKASGIGIYVNTALAYPLLLPYTAVYGLLMATAAYTPGNAEVYTVTLTGEASW